MSKSDSFNKIDPDLENRLLVILKSKGIDLKDQNQDGLKMTQVSETIQSYILSSKNHIYSVSNSRLVMGDEKEFFKMYNAIWGQCIKSSFLFLQLIDDYCQNVEIFADEEHVKDFVLGKIMGKAMRIYLEVITLLTNGFPYGAASLTRSLFELMITTRFIKNCNNDVALAYYKASDKPLNQQDYDDYG